MDIKELRKMQPQKSIDIREAPEKFEAVLLEEHIGKDRNGKECVYWDLGLEGGGILRQKYTPSHISELVFHLEALRVKDTTDLVGKRMGFEKKATVGFPRWYPVAIL